MHGRRMMVKVPGDVLEFIDMVRGNLPRSSAAALILRLWKDDHATDGAPLRSYRIANTPRCYAMETSTRSPHAFCSHMEMIAWIAQNPRDRQRLSLRFLPSDITYDMLCALPTTSVDVPRLDLGD